MFQYFDEILSDFKPKPNYIDRPRSNIIIIGIIIKSFTHHKRGIQSISTTRSTRDRWRRDEGGPVKSIALASTACHAHTTHMQKGVACESTCTDRATRQLYCVRASPMSKSLSKYYPMLWTNAEMVLKHRRQGKADKVNDRFALDVLGFVEASTPLLSHWSLCKQMLLAHPCVNTFYWFSAGWW